MGCGGSSPGRCEPASCGDPPAITNGGVTVSNNGLFPDGKAVYACNAGYAINNGGDVSLSCGADGKWKGTVPTCGGITCQAISVTDPLSVAFSNGRKYPSQATFSCDAKHFLSGAQTLTCLTSGTWNAPTPSCVPVGDAMDLTVECSSNDDADIAAWLDKLGLIDVPGDVQCGDKSVTWSHDFSQIKAKLDDGCGGNTGSGEVTFTGNDNCGHQVQTSATVTIEDKLAPTIRNVPADTTMSCSAQVPQQAPTLVAADACDPNVDAVGQQKRTDGSCSSRYTLTHTWTATDACGNTETAMQTVKVTDTEAPTLLTEAKDASKQCVADKVEAQYQEWLDSHGSASARDSCTDVTWTYQLVSDSAGCGATFDRRVSFTASDDCGQGTSTTATFTVADTTPPGFQPPQTPRAVSCSSVPPLADLAATDSCSDVTQEKTETRIDGACPQNYALSRAWVLSDACGNMARAQQLVAVTDKQAPVIDTPAGDLVLDCNRQTQQAQIDAWLQKNGNAAASDDCSDKLTWSHNFDDVADDLKAACGGTGKATVTFTVADECGNEAETSATVEIRDITPPAFGAVAQDKDVECDGAGNTAEVQAWVDAMGGATATDACSLDTQLTWSHEKVSSTVCGVAERQVYTFTVTDACGQSSKSEATFSILDRQAPKLALAGGNPQLAEAYFPWVDPGLAGIEDACHEVPVTETSVSEAPTTDTLGTYNVTYTATDPCGFSGSATRQIIVRDTLAPRVAIKGAKRIVLREGSFYADPGATAKDYPAASPSTVSLLRRSYTYNVDGMVDVREGQDTDSVAQQAGEHYIIYSALDESSNRVEHLGRVLTVLSAKVAGRGRKAVWKGVVDASNAFSVPAKGPSGAAAGATATAPLAEAFSFIIASGDGDVASVRQLFNGTGLPADLNLACFPDALPAHTRCVASHDIVTASQLRNLGRKVLVSTAVQPVVGFAGTIGLPQAAGATPASMAAKAKGLLAQQGIDTATVSGCDGGLCFYTAADRPSLNAFSVPVTAPTRLLWVKVRAATGASPAFILASLSLQGVTPTYFAFQNGAGTVAFRGLYNVHDFEAAGLTVTSATTTAGLELTLRVDSAMSEADVRAVLLAAAVMPDSLTLSAASGDATAQMVSVVTYSDLAGLSSLKAATGVQAVVSVAPLPTEALPSSSVAGRYQYELRLNVDMVDVTNASLVLQTAIDALAVIKVTPAEPRIVQDNIVRFGSNTLIRENMLDKLEKLDELDSIVKLNDMFDEISAGLRSVIDRILPVNPDRVDVYAEPLPASGFDSEDGGDDENRRRREGSVGTPVELEVVIDVPPKGTSGDSFYVARFEMKPSASAAAADAKARRILEDLEVCCNWGFRST